MCICVGLVGCRNGILSTYCAYAIINIDGSSNKLLHLCTTLRSCVQDASHLILVIIQVISHAFSIDIVLGYIFVFEAFFSIINGVWKCLVGWPYVLCILLIYLINEAANINRVLECFRSTLWVISVYNIICILLLLLGAIIIRVLLRRIGGLLLLSCWTINANSLVAHILTSHLVEAAWISIICLLSQLNISCHRSDWLVLCTDVVRAA